MINSTFDMFQVFLNLPNPTSCRIGNLMSFSEIYLRTISSGRLVTTDFEVAMTTNFLKAGFFRGRDPPGSKIQIK